MARGRPRLPDSVKAAKGTLKKIRIRPQPTPTALEEWPDPPEGFSEAEARAWSRLGVAALPLGVLGAPDLILVEYTAKAMARLDVMISEGDAPATAFNAAFSLVSMMLRNLGLSPLSRSTVTPLPKEKASADEDSLSEFARG